MANPNLCLCWMVDSIGFCGSPFFPTETNLIPMKSWHSRRLFEIQAQSTNDGNHLCLVCVRVCECAVQFYLLECSWLFSGVFCIVLQFCIVSVSGQSLSWYNWPNVFARDDIIFVGRIFDIGFFFFFFSLRCVLCTQSISGAFDVHRKCAAGSKIQFHKRNLEQ